MRDAQGKGVLSHGLSPRQNAFRHENVPAIQALAGWDADDFSFKA
jgi:hypothetical protein